MGLITLVILIIALGSVIYYQWAKLQQLEKGVADSDKARQQSEKEIQEDIIMNNSELQNVIDEGRDNLLAKFTDEWFQKLIQEGQYIGNVYSISYETASVLIHDHFRQEVGGIPSLSFLIATRIKPDQQKIDYMREDTSMILLRVMDAVPLPTSNETERIRVESAQLVSGEPSRHWDDPEAMDPQTSQQLSFAGVGCRVIGTFFLDLASNDPPKLVTRFGSDLSNYYPNQGLTVYKPNDNALKEIVNYQDPDRREDLRNHTRVAIGEVRYASTNRSFQGISDVGVSISPADLLEQKTALFGMTRTGKSNTTKIIAKSVFDLRFDIEVDEPPRIGQIIFDPDGEYANENVQDANEEKNPSALKNVWQSNENGKKEDIVTYGTMEHPDDLERKIMLLNFYEDRNLQNGKDIIDAVLTEESSAYIRNFRQIVFDEPDSNDRSAMTRYKRRVLAYRALLAKAGFEPPNDLSSSPTGLFNQELLTHMEDSESNNAPNYKSAAKVFGNPVAKWGQLHTAFENLARFISDSNSGYKKFENWYVDRPGGSGDNWADEDLKKILEMFRYPNGARLIGQARSQHTNSTTEDYAVEIYNHLLEGKLVIIDQSSGEPKVNESSAERIMWEIFYGNRDKFRLGEEPSDILIYIEEAHNLLPAGSESDLKNVWVRTAKEGAKYRLGMVYVTQEVSSIQKNILKNTSNWFIGHLNNTDETKELCKFYDFVDFERSILRAQDRGFLRVKTLSNPFVVPVQIQKFEV